jgi:hypothetical protein
LALFPTFEKGGQGGFFLAFAPSKHPLFQRRLKNAISRVNDLEQDVIQGHDFQTYQKK